MFDIGFAELVLVAVVGLLVIGPERLPGAIRTGSLWLNKFKRGFNDIKREVQQELHNDAVMQELRKTGEQLQQQAESIGQGVGAQPSSGPDPDGSDAASDPPQKTAEPGGRDSA